LRPGACVFIYSPGEQNGVRLVGGSGPRGRLEVSFRERFVGGERTFGPLATAAVCDGPGFTDNTALVSTMGLTYIRTGGHLERWGIRYRQ
jgi:hypothetical protein